MMFKSVHISVSINRPAGAKVYNPMRVFPNNDGSELIFTLYRRPGMSDQMFAEDAEAVTRDLKKLKALLENDVNKED